MNNNFDEDLEDGHKGEKVVRHFVETVWHKRFLTYGNTNKFDIMFQNVGQYPVFFEVKTDYWEKEMDEGGSGNMAIEYKCRGKPSGIRTTIAQWYAYYFPNLSGDQLWIINVEKLKELIKENNFKRVSAGETYYDSDDKVAKCFLIPRFDFKKYFQVFTWDGRGWLISLE